MITLCNLVEKTSELSNEMGLTDIQKNRLMAHIKNRVDLVSEHQYKYINISFRQLVNMINQVSNL